MSAAPHMLNLAEGVRLILERRHPQYAWVVDVGECEDDKRPGLAAVPLDVDEASAVADHSDAIDQRGATAAPAGTRDDHDLHQAA